MEQEGPTAPRAKKVMGKLLSWPKKLISPCDENEILTFVCFFAGHRKDLMKSEIFSVLIHYKSLPKIAG